MKFPGSVFLEVLRKRIDKQQYGSNTNPKPLVINVEPPTTIKGDQDDSDND